MRRPIKAIGDMFTSVDDPLAQPPQPPHRPPAARPKLAALKLESLFESIRELRECLEHGTPLRPELEGLGPWEGGPMGSWFPPLLELPEEIEGMPDWVRWEWTRRTIFLLRQGASMAAAASRAHHELVLGHSRRQLALEVFDRPLTINKRARMTQTHFDPDRSVTGQ